MKSEIKFLKNRSTELPLKECGNGKMVQRNQNSLMGGGRAEVV